MTGYSLGSIAKRHHLAGGDSRLRHRPGVRTAERRDICHLESRDARSRDLALQPGPQYRQQHRHLAGASPADSQHRHHALLSCGTCNPRQAPAWHNPAVAAAFGAHAAAGAALLDAAVNQQAAMIAYIDDFWFMLFLTLLVTPLLLLIRPPRGPVTEDAHAVMD